MNIPKLQEEQLTHITQKIIEAVDPELIICYGSRTTEMQDWGSFMDKGGYRRRVHPSFDLLIITAPDEKHHDYETVQTAEQQAIYPVSINCIAHKISHVNEAIKANNPFYCSVSLKGKTIYSAGRETLLPCDKIPVRNASLEWNRLFSQANHFLSLASHAFSCAWHSQTVFLLHQAVENACNAMIRFFTGYHSSTHNLSRLLSITETFSCVPMSIFPGITKEENELLNLLNRGYSEARYKENYEVAADKVIILLERVKLFLSVAESLHKKGIDFIDDPDATYFSLTGNEQYIY